ncbi:MAG: Spermidine/putrescine import ABC transporter permease protein PotC, partial [uncultured Rubrobacteraceae bacterium]
EREDRRPRLQGRGEDPGSGAVAVLGPDLRFPVRPDPGPDVLLVQLQQEHAELDRLLYRMVRGAPSGRDHPPSLLQLYEGRGDGHAHRHRHRYVHGAGAHAPRLQGQAGGRHHHLRGHGDARDRGRSEPAGLLCGHPDPARHRARHSDHSHRARGVHRLVRDHRGAGAPRGDGRVSRRSGPGSWGQPDDDLSTGNATLDLSRRHGRGPAGVHAVLRRLRDYVLRLGRGIEHAALEDLLHDQVRRHAGHQRALHRGARGHHSLDLRRQPPPRAKRKLL